MENLQSKVRVLFDDVVETEYSQVYLEWGSSIYDGDNKQFFSGQSNGLAGASHPGVLILFLANFFGEANLLIQQHPAEPLVHLESEDVVEVSVNIQEGSQVKLVTWAAEETFSLDLKPGEYRVRYSAFMMDEARKRKSTDSLQQIDHYILDLWSKPFEQDSIIRSSSTAAKELHAAV